MIDPVAFTIGPIQVHWYGILIAAAALVGTLLATRVARWLGEDPEEAWSMLLVVMAFAHVPRCPRHPAFRHQAAVVMKDGDVLREFHGAQRHALLVIACVEHRPRFIGVA